MISVPRSPKGLAGFQYRASVCLNLVTAALFSPPMFDSDGMKDENRERSGLEGSGEALGLASGVAFESATLPNRAGV